MCDDVVHTKMLPNMQKKRRPRWTQVNSLFQSRNVVETEIRKHEKETLKVFSRRRKTVWSTTLTLYSFGYLIVCF